MPPILKLFSLALTCVPVVLGAYNPSSKDNIAIYWGQNSYGQATGAALSQQRLVTYCANTQLDIIPLAFLTTISNPSLNFANAGDLCTTIAGTNLFYCSQLEADITACQTTYGKTIILSIGGATYTEGGFSTSAAAVAAANNIWAIFGPYSATSTSPRPFGKAVVNGFDFDFEATVSNMPPFGQQLRALMNANTASTGKTWLLTAAPQCPYPDAADGPMLAGTVFFDIVWIQFYNNYCGVNSYIPGASTQNNFNFATWDNWAKTVSLNKNVKLMLGIPGNTGAAGSGYLTPNALAPVIAYSKSFSSFAGVMIWDMSQVWANNGFLTGVENDLGLPPTSTQTTTLVTVTTKPPTTSTKPPVTTPTPGGGTIPQWGQCGGDGYVGSGKCASPYICHCLSKFWCQCE